MPDGLVAVSLIALALLSPVAPADAWLEHSITYWADMYGLDPACFRELAYRESKLDPRALGGKGERGLYQFKPGTWEWAASRVGVDADFDAAYNPWLNARVAAGLLSHYQGKYDSWWSAYPGCGCEVRVG